jgi:hypothetical protein
MSNNHVIDDVKIVLGQCIRVKNVEKEQHPESYKRYCDEYIAIQVEDYSGDDEYCILLTHIDHTDMESVQFPYSMLNNMVAGRIYPVTIANKKTNLIKVNHWDGRTRILRISNGQLDAAKKRAKNHPFSCTKKSVLTDMMD